MRDGCPDLPASVGRRSGAQVATGLLNAPAQAREPRPRITGPLDRRAVVADGDHAGAVSRMVPRHRYAPRTARVAQDVRRR